MLVSGGGGGAAGGVVEAGFRSSTWYGFRSGAISFHDDDDAVVGSRVMRLVSAAIPG